MGAVFQAVHGPSGREYALKALSARASKELRERFAREGQAQARVDGHPNVVRVHSAGEADGALYLVMDVARGGDLAERLRHGPLPPADAAKLVAALARGLEHVHSHGVLHRDLKPANVLFGDGDVPKLVDFGLARIAGEASSLTRTGEILGTPSYMSPEQCQGIKGEVTACSDVYGLGAIFYHCLTGSPPFTGPTALAILTQVVSTRPTPPRSLAPNVPAPLEAVCLKALAKSPKDRFGSAAEFRVALEQSAQGSPSSASQNRMLVRIGAIAAGVLAVTLALTLALAKPTANSAESGEAPDVPQPVAKAAPTAIPAPAPLTFKPRPFVDAEAFRCRLKVTGTRAFLPPEDGPLHGEPRGNVTFSYSLDFAFVVDWVEARQAQITGTIEALTVRRSASGREEVNFDSTRAPIKLQSPFRAALGRSLGLVVDQRSGHVKNVTGALSIKNHVLLEARKQYLPYEQYVLEGFDSPLAMRSALNKVLHLFPMNPNLPLSESWTLPEIVDMAKVVVSDTPDALASFGAKPLHDLRTLGVEREFQATESARVLNLTWSGEDEIRVQSGTARLTDGRVSASSSQERIEVNFGDTDTGEIRIRVVVETHIDYEVLGD